MPEQTPSSTHRMAAVTVWREWSIWAVQTVVTWAQHK